MQYRHTPTRRRVSRRIFGHRHSTIVVYLIAIAVAASAQTAPTSSASSDDRPQITAAASFGTPQLAVAAAPTRDPTTTNPNAAAAKSLAQRTLAAQPPAETPPPNTTSTTLPTPSTAPPKKAAPITPVSFSVAAGGSLPNGTTCATRVTKMRERVPANVKANKTKPTGKLNFAGNFGSNNKANAYLARVDGNYTGTTDEIIQWASCKWGIDPDIVRAQAFVESTWRQGALGGIANDQQYCVAGMKAPCPRAFGILQIRADYQKNTYPNSAISTAFNLDYSLAYWRTVYDGVSWLGTKPKGDLWGSIGAFYSGKYDDDPGKAYVAETQKQLRLRPWMSW